MVRVRHSPGLELVDVSSPAPQSSSPASPSSPHQREVTARTALCEARQLAAPAASMLLSAVACCLYTASLAHGPPQSQAAAAEDWACANNGRLTGLVVAAAVLWALAFTTAAKCRSRAAALWGAAVLCAELAGSDMGTDTEHHGQFNLAGLVVFGAMAAGAIGVVLGVRALKLRPVHYAVAAAAVAACFTPAAVVGANKWAVGLKGQRLVSHSPGCTIKRPWVDVDRMADPLKYAAHGWWALRPCKVSPSHARIDNVTLDLVVDAGAGCVCTYYPFYTENSTNMLRYVQRNQVVERCAGVVPESHWRPGVRTQAVVVECGADREILTPRIRRDPAVAAASEARERSYLASPRSNAAYRAAGRAPDVVWVYIDAVSRPQAFRKLRKTTALLERIAGDASSPAHLTQAMRYHTVGDNTSPNSRGLFQGTLEYSSRPFIWEIYSRAGYVTFIADNTCAEWAYKYGNRSSPPDVSPNSIWCAPEYTGLKEDGYSLWRGGSAVKTRCIAGRKTDELVFDYATSFAEAYSDRPKFSLLKFSEGHEITATVVSTMDEDLSAYLSSLDLNNTIVFLFADHGLHMGLTWMFGFYSVRLENRLPFMFLSIPKWLSNSANYAATLDSNEERQPLVIGADLFATATDLLLGWPNEHTMAHHNSLLSVNISTERNCEQATIPSDICRCS
eukprot:m51a1_g9974 hypothetical protein (676) ;mRNA; f:109299-111841